MATATRTNADKLVALCAELCGNVAAGLLSVASAADAIAAAGSAYVPDPAPIEQAAKAGRPGSCLYTIGALDTMFDCANNGCVLCIGELDVV